MSDLVTIDVKDFVADVRLNRPEKYNSLSTEMFEAIIAASEQLAAMEDVRAVVLSGNGKGFCAGLDLANFSGSMNPNDFFSKDLEFPNVFQNVAYCWKRLPMPVIAAIHGVAYGGGLQIALGADIRLAAASAKFSVMEIKWGLIPDMSASQTLRDLVRIDVAKELTFTGRIVEGAEAVELGLVTRIEDDPLASAFALAKEIAGKSPDAIALGKQLFEQAWHGNDLEGLALEESLQKQLMGQANQMESVFANMQKRAPNFKQRVVNKPR